MDYIPSQHPGTASSPDTWTAPVAADSIPMRDEHLVSETPED
jgi:hypothetical protein